MAPFCDPDAELYDGFEVMIVDCETELRPIGQFPHSGQACANALAAALNGGGLVSEPWFGQQTEFPLVIAHKNKRWLLVRDLVPSVGLGILMDAAADRRKDMEICELVLKASALCCVNGYGISVCESRVTDGAETDPLPSRLCGPSAELWVGGDVEQAARCIGSLARLIGCGLELEYEGDDVDKRNVPIGAAAAIAAISMLVCRNAGENRSAQMTLVRRGDEVELTVSFELCRELCIDRDDIVESEAVAVCRRLADRYNTVFDLTVEAGSVRGRICLECREWSYLGVKHPTGLEYDESGCD